jgi:transcriptional regulator with XRE-family HTH domain
MNYAEVLNYFIRLTNCRVGTIAKLLNYDISYISKWINDKRKPSFKNITKINNELSKLFAHHIYNDKLVEQFENDFDLIVRNSKNENVYLTSIENNVYRCLDLAYKDKLEKNNQSSKGNYEYIIGNIEIKNTLVGIFRRVFTDKTKDIEIYWSINILSSLSQFLLKLIDIYRNEGQMINLHCVYSRKYINDDVFSIFGILNKNKHINLELYENTSFANFNFISIPNYLFIDLSMDQGKLITMSYGYNNHLTNPFSKLLVDYFNQSKKIIEINRDIKFASTNFITSFYTRDRYTIFLNKGFEFLLPTEVIRDISHSGYGDNYDQIFLLELNEITQDFFEKSIVDIIIPEKALVQYFKEGIFYFNSKEFKLKEDQLDLHIEKIINTLKENSMFKIYISSDKMLEKFNNKSFNFYSNGEFMYFKKYIDENSPPKSNISVVHNHIFNNIAVKFLQGIILAPYTRELNYNELRNLYKDARKKASIK